MHREIRIPRDNLQRESMFKLKSNHYFIPLQVYHDVKIANDHYNVKAILEAYDKRDGIIPIFSDYESEYGVLCRILPSSCIHYLNGIYDISKEKAPFIKGIDLVCIKAIRNYQSVNIYETFVDYNPDKEYDYKEEIKYLDCDIDTINKLIKLSSRESNFCPLNNPQKILKLVYSIAEEFVNFRAFSYEEVLYNKPGKLVSRLINHIEAYKDNKDINIRFDDPKKAGLYILENNYPEQIKEVANVEKDNNDGYGKTLSYLNFLINFPWNTHAQMETDFDKVAKALDEYHYGMHEVKKRVIENLAVHQRTNGKVGQIICLVGSPGVGKTSFAKSVAKALNLPFQKISMSGQIDPRMLRGFNKSYVASTSGKFVSCLNYSKCMNPLILIDEVDKAGSCSEGNATDALLEALDPSQNYMYNDDYLNTYIDLSHVTFICTANYPEQIPAALKDRMDIIYMDDYSVEDRKIIFNNYVFKAALKESGLTQKEVKLSKDVGDYIVENYSYDSGIRQLERCARRICSKVCLQLAKDSNLKTITITMKNLNEYLDESLIIKKQIIKTKAEVGVSNALAVNGYNQGAIFKIECSTMKGNGKLNITGNLSSMTQESCEIAYEFIKCNCDYFGIEQDYFDNHDICVHFTKTAYPKDGNSAGIAFVTAIISAITGKTTIDNLSLTGEISLRGSISAIGGLKQKIYGALDNGIKTIIIPEDNLEDLKKIPDKVLNQLSIIQADNYLNVYKQIFA